MCSCVFPENKISVPQIAKPHLKLYNRWYSMIERCYNPKRKDFIHYGGRGIRVSQEWMEDFQKFIKDTGIPGEGMTIDRIKNDLNYCKCNFKWSSRTDQNLNRRPLTKKSDLPKYVYRAGNLFKAQVRINKVIHRVACSKDLQVVLDKLKEFCLETFGRYPN